MNMSSRTAGLADWYQLYWVLCSDIQHDVGQKLTCCAPWLLTFGRLYQPYCMPPTHLTTPLSPLLHAAVWSAVELQHPSGALSACNQQLESQMCQPSQIPIPERLVGVLSDPVLLILLLIIFVSPIHYRISGYLLWVYAIHLWLMPE